MIPRFKNYVTHKSLVQPKTIADAGGNAYVTQTALSSEANVTKRAVRKRQFYQALVHSHNTTTQSYIITLELVSGTDRYVMDRVTLAAGETHVWNELDYGVDLLPTEYMRLSWIVSSAHTDDKITLIIRTRDLT
tara:strand:+ start:99 stop:500 length:402 start_codon:yes stop_codon:yes gene_type:complete